MESELQFFPLFPKRRKRGAGCSYLLHSAEREKGEERQRNQAAFARYFFDNAIQGRGVEENQRFISFFCGSLGGGR